MEGNQRPGSILHVISRVHSGSIAEEMGMEPGDILEEINGRKISDIFDYQYQTENDYIEVLIRKKNSEEEWLLEIEKDADEDLGIEFENGLMDDYRSCTNHCVFCFIDQNPPGMRETIYFKDDDSRLSFLQGNYVTLTNMSDSDIDRIIAYRLGPINISIQTTNPDLRRKMLHNRFAGDVFGKIRKLADSGIDMNAQIVLCRDLNDGKELDRTIGDLESYMPGMKSLSVVPVGLTRFRKGLYPLLPFDKKTSGEVIDQIEGWQRFFLKKHGTRFVHASDEWYLTAGRKIPGAEVYEGFGQIENGVGMLRLLDTEIDEALDVRVAEEKNRRDPDKPFPPPGVAEDSGSGHGKRRSCRRCTIATGTLAAPFIRKQAEKVGRLYPELEVSVCPIQNDFYGHRITVSGLLTGRDLIRQLRGRDLGDALLIPCNMLRYGENVFLDNVTVEELEKAVHTPVQVVDSDGASFVENLLGVPEHKLNRRQMYEQTDCSGRGPSECRKVDVV